MTSFHFVPEFDDELLRLFPHRHDYIWAEHPRPGESPDWKTESKHLLSDRHIKAGAYLYGVRFTKTTRYALLDIDRKSVYHPTCDKFAILRILAALEPLGLTDYVAVTSSYNGGLHLYFPFEESITSWRIATAITHLLNRAGFMVQDGILEVFPNCRNYDPDSITLFKGHRLPLQAGSYILNRDWATVYTTPEKFAAQWHWCSSRNAINVAVLDRAISEVNARDGRLSKKAQKFLTDLDTEIDPGWTSHGQTNFILGRITLRSYIFGHFLEGGEPLRGEKLAQKIVETAINLPGFNDWCRHKYEIWRRAVDWARCVENSHYFPYRMPKAKQEQEQEQGTSEAAFNWNKWQRTIARDRIRFALANLLEQGRLPAGAADRCEALIEVGREMDATGRGFSVETLYHHRDLWHPDHLWKTPQTPPDSLSAMGSRGARPSTHTSLLAVTEGKPLIDKASTWFKGWKFTSTGCNPSSGQGLSDFNGDSGGGSG